MRYEYGSIYIKRPVALIGPRGSGKTTVGIRLAKTLGIPFFDTDQEVEKAAGGYNVKEIHEHWGKDAFRAAERAVIERLLRTQPVHILSTGEGAFTDPVTREILLEKTTTIWLKSDFETLVTRLQRKERPPLEGDNEDFVANLRELMQRDLPHYQHADAVVESNDAFYDHVVKKVIDALHEYSYPIPS